MKRISKHEYYLNIAKAVSLRATDLRASMGSVIVSFNSEGKEDRIISTGYNGSPSGVKDDIEWGFSVRKELNVPSGQRYELDTSVHAEQNAMLNCSRQEMRGSTLYIYGERLIRNKSNQIIETENISNMYPCFVCKKLILNSGISRVFTMSKEGKIREFLVEDWRKEWSENHMLESEDCYGENDMKENIKKIKEKYNT